jgi:hypothetical protein
VEKYDDDKQKKWYRNLNTIANKTLDEIQAEEKAYHEAHQESVGEWNKTYYFEHHRIAMSILVALGFDVKDEKTVSRELIEAAFAKNKAEWKKQHKHFVATLKIRPKMQDFTKVEQSMKYLNAILYAVYGVKIICSSRKKTERNDFQIQHQHLFDKTTFEPVVTQQAVVEDKKEIAIELNAADIDIVNQFIESLY